MMTQISGSINTLPMVPLSLTPTPTLTFDPNPDPDPGPDPGPGPDPDPDHNPHQVLAGDFNSLPGSDPHTLLSSGGVTLGEASDLARDLHGVVSGPAL